MNIEPISNGWLATETNGDRKAFYDIQSLFEYLLLSLEGKSEHFGGSMYGKVTVNLVEKVRGKE